MRGEVDEGRDRKIRYQVVTQSVPIYDQSTMPRREAVHANDKELQC